MVRYNFCRTRKRVVVLELTGLEISFHAMIWFGREPEVLLALLPFLNKKYVLFILVIAVTSTLSVVRT